MAQAVRVPEAGEEAPDVLLTDDQRRPVRLSELWAAGPAVLVFYRGEWSPPCRKQLIDYRDNALAFRQLGARVAGISTDEPHAIAVLRTERALPFDLLSDEERFALLSWNLLDGVASDGGVARPATFVVDAQGVIRSATLDSDERRTPARSVLRFLERGGTATERTPRAGLQRLLGRVKAIEQQLTSGLRGPRSRRT
jgi:peroxiredoxin